MMGLSLRRIVLSGVVFANNKAKRLGIRLTRWTGKSREHVHPKHLLGETEQNYWYLAHITPGATVLDVGCGNGMHLFKAARRCRQVVGVDGSLDSLGVALRTGRTLPSPNAVFFAANLEQGLPAQGSRFDTVICLDLLEHVYQRDLLLTEIRKIEYTLEKLEEELARNGFRIVHLHPTVYDTPLIGAIDLVGGLSLGLYRSLTVARRRLARRYPEENAGFFAVCATK
jgi:SAM-dependent methyltransferase